MTNIINFDDSCIYHADLSNAISYGNIDKKILFNIFKDGRVGGLINESLICSLFKNLIKNPHENSAYDVSDLKYGTTYEVKSVTKLGTKTCPSSMVGIGRTYDSNAHLEKMIHIDFFLFIDIRSFPQLYFYPLPADTNELLVKNITPKKFDKIIEKYHNGKKSIKVIVKNM